MIGQFNETVKDPQPGRRPRVAHGSHEETWTNSPVAFGQPSASFPIARVAMIDRSTGWWTPKSPPISISVSNLVKFSEELDKLAAEMALTVATNRIELTKGVKNLERTTAVLERLANDVEAGKGLAGTLIKDQELKFDLSNTVSNLAVLSSNLNKYGLLYKPRQPKTSQPPRSESPGRNPFK